MGSPEPSPPAAARTLLRRLGEGWTARTQPATGSCEFSGYGPPRGDGTRPQIALVETVDSFRIQATHMDGRALVAVWMHRHGHFTKTGHREWKLDMAWRGRRSDEYTPKQLTATQLKAYVEWSGSDGEAA